MVPPARSPGSQTRSKSVILQRRVNLRQGLRKVKRLTSYVQLAIGEQASPRRINTCQPLADRNSGILRLTLHRIPYTLHLLKIHLKCVNYIRTRHVTFALIHVFSFCQLPVRLFQPGTMNAEPLNLRNSF